MSGLKPFEDKHLISGFTQNSGRKTYIIAIEIEIVRVVVRVVVVVVVVVVVGVVVTFVVPIVVPVVVPIVIPVVVLIVVSVVVSVTVVLVRIIVFVKSAFGLTVFVRLVRVTVLVNLLAMLIYIYVLKTGTKWIFGRVLRIGPPLAAMLVPITFIYRAIGVHRGVEIQAGGSKSSRINLFVL